MSAWKPERRVTLLLDLEVREADFTDGAEEIYREGKITQTELAAAVFDRLNWGDQHPGHPLFKRGNLRISVRIVPNAASFEEET